MIHEAESLSGAVGFVHHLNHLCYIKKPKNNSLINNQSYNIHMLWITFYLFS